MLIIACDKKRSKRFPEVYSFLRIIKNKFPRGPMTRNQRLGPRFLQNLGPCIRLFYYVPGKALKSLLWEP